MLYSVISEPPLQPLGGGCFDQRYSLCYDQDVLISPPAENLAEQSFSEPYLRQYISSCESQWSYYSPLKPMRTLHLTPSPLPSPLLSKWQSPNSEETPSPFVQQSPFKVEDDVFYTWGSLTCKQCTQFPLNTYNTKYSWSGTCLRTYMKREKLYIYYNKTGNKNMIDCIFIYKFDLILNHEYH